MDVYLKQSGINYFIYIRLKVYSATFMYPRRCEEYFGDSRDLDVVIDRSVHVCHWGHGP